MTAEVEILLAEHDNAPRFRGTRFSISRTRIMWQCEGQTAASRGERSSSGLAIAERVWSRSSKASSPASRLRRSRPS